MTRVAPLVARVEPIPGETLMSLAARAAHTNVFPKLAELLRHAGIKGHPAFAPFTAADRAEPLAELLGVPLDQVVQRFHPLHPDPSIKGAVVWAGARMRRRSIEARARRVAPMALAISPHHRLEWTHRALSFCPYTFQHLISACPPCGRELGWVSTKGLDRCEHCEASLADAPAPMVQTRWPELLAGSVQLISPDLELRAQALSTLAADFHTWDPGDAFSAACELGVAWRHPQEGRGSDTARALMDGSHEFEPDDLAVGVAMLRRWPEMAGPLLKRLASHVSTRRTGEDLTAAHLGVLGRHLTGDEPTTPLQRLLADAVRAEAEGRRRAKAAATLERLQLDVRKEGSIGLVEACKAHGVSRSVLSRLVPHGRSLISAQSRRQGGVRFDRDRLAATIIAFKSSIGFTEVSQMLGVPRYCLPAFVERGLLEQPDDPDVALMFASPAVTARSLSHLRHGLEGRKDVFRTRFTLNSLGAHLRRRFDPVVWAEAFRLTARKRGIRMIGYSDEKIRHQIVDWIFVIGEELYRHLPEDRADHVDRSAVVSAQEAGRLLGLPSAHLPELIDARVLRAVRRGQSWDLTLGDVVDFHALFVTGSELRQRSVTTLVVEATPLPSVDDYKGALRTRHFRLFPREALERDWEWPDPTLR